MQCPGLRHRVFKLIISFLEEILKLLNEYLAKASYSKGQKLGCLNSDLNYNWAKQIRSAFKDIYYDHERGWPHEMPRIIDTITVPCALWISECYGLPTENYKRRKNPNDYCELWITESLNAYITLKQEINTCINLSRILAVLESF